MKLSQKNLDLFIGCSLLVAASATAKTQVAQYVPNRILIKNTHPALFENANIQNLREMGVFQLEKSVNEKFDILRFSTSLDAIEVSHRIMESQMAEWAQPDYLMSLPFIKEKNQVATKFGQLPSLLDGFVSGAADPEPANPPELPSPGKTDPMMKEIWGLSKIQADKVWNTQTGSTDIIVADIDTGVDYNHKDLVNNIWRNPKPTKNDLVGYDFANEDPLPYDDFGHGTHTAGTIGATGSNGIGIAGVNHRVSIMVLKFLGGESGQGTTSDAIECIDYAVANGARVINASWGGYVGVDDPENKVLVDAIERAEAANVLFVAAAGNDGRDIGVDLMLPGGIENPAVLTVASTTVRDTRSFFSNFSTKKVHVAAPGSDIYSTIPGNNYTRYSGTSMAAPHVAGLAALILSERPELSAVEVKEIIQSTVDPLDSLKGKIKSGGRVNAKAALERAKAFGI